MRLANRLLPALGAGLLLSACASIGTPVAAGHSTNPAHTTTLTGTHVTIPVWPGPHQPPAGYAWRPVPASPYLAEASTDGSAVTLLWMDTAKLKFRYVPGTKYPEGSPRTAADINPATWTARMLAVFNGGFKLSDHVGGYYYLGQQVAPLRPGYAALVLYKDGSLRLGEWGRDLRLTSDVLMVRENMAPFVDHGVAQTKATDTYRTWGFTFHHRWLVNRSAIGQLADGTLVFAYGHNVRPDTMAAALVAAGARFAVDLDMNGYFPAGDTYIHVGNRVYGTKLNPAVQHLPSLYYRPYLKDFFVVESR